MNASFAPDSHSVISTLVAWWRDRHETNRQLDELAQLSPEDLAEVAADCGVSTYDLVTIIKAGPHAADEMQQMLRALNVDAAAVEDANRRLYQDMMATCAECRDKARCRRDLANGKAAENYTHYCANSQAINELRAMPDMLVE
jgi:uncharacterized protein YjiS (DUF1127 family)